MIRIARNDSCHPADATPARDVWSESVAGKLKKRSWIHVLLATALLVAGCHFWSQNRPAPWVGPDTDNKLDRWLERHPIVHTNLVLTGVGCGVVALGALYLIANSEPDTETPPPKKKK